jgi:Brp/Blh family beta-carotene 15,15'-monooxygenase
MHGATDHFLDLNTKEKTTQSKIPLSFFAQYLIAILIMAVFWWLFPYAALALFILSSGYHFGQTQWQYLALPEKSILKKLLYLIWGLMIILMIVIYNAKESNDLINSITAGVAVETFRPLLYACYSIFIIILFLIRKHLHRSTLLYEIIELICIYFVSVQTNLLISFGLFFGLWHSFRAAQVQIDKIRKDQRFEIKDFIKGSLPFTLISLFGIALLIWISSLLNQSIQPPMLFLIAISALTMPHMIIYEGFYNKHSI